MHFEIHPFEIKHRHLPNKTAFLLKKEGRFSEVSPLPGRSRETAADALEQLSLIQKKGANFPLYPSVAFGLYGLTCPIVSSIPCALFLCGTPDEVIKISQTPHGCTTAKLKVGSWSIEDALRVIPSLHFKLRLDFNHMWEEKAVHKLCHHLDPDQIEFLEDPGCKVPGFRVATDGREVWKPMVQGLPPLKHPVILSSSLETTIGLHQIAALLQTHDIPSHTLGIGTVLNLQHDIVQNGAFLRGGRLHFPTPHLKIG